MLILCKEFLNLRAEFHIQWIKSSVSVKRNTFSKQRGYSRSLNWSTVAWWATLISTCWRDKFLSVYTVTAWLTLDTNSIKSEENYICAVLKYARKKYQSKGMWVSFLKDEGQQKQHRASSSPESKKRSIALRSLFFWKLELINTACLNELYSFTLNNFPAGLL